MVSNRFLGPRAKIARSKRHLDELVSVQAIYSQKQPLHLETRPTASGGMALVAKATRLPSGEDATIVADILGNLRSSLDLAVCEASRLCGATSTGGTYFHAAQTEHQWDCRVKGRMVAAPDWLKQLVRGLQPWEGGNKLLYSLSKLAAGDKHQLLIPIAGAAGRLMLDGVGFTHRDGAAGKVTVTLNQPHWEISRQEALILEVDEGSEIQIVGPSVFQAAFSFGDVYGLSYQPVVVVLNQMGSMCEQIIDLIEEATSRNIPS